ncbi:hypothetical protein [Actinomadura flavalba]|uniref:hypothetical protein n=1 Tax=Actinomadura flavalba TaxID=1120938 RepID=UPI00036F5AB5|nr:hypothetical protein [Actinomadura flavalba]
MVVAGVAVGAVPAGAAAVKARVSAAPETVRLVAAATAPLTVQADYGTCMEHALVEIESAGGEGYDYQDLPGNAEGRFTATFALTNDEVRGVWDVTVSGSDCATGRLVTQRKAATVQVKRDTRITGFDASPEPAAKGTPVALKGVLTRLDPWANTYVPYQNAKVRFEFRGTGGAWTPMGTAVTAKDGTFAGSVPAEGAGVWRAVFPGTAAHAPATAPGDTVALG